MRKATILIALALFAAIAFAEVDTEVEEANEVLAEEEENCMAETDSEWLSRCYRGRWIRCRKVGQKYCYGRRKSCYAWANKERCPKKRPAKFASCRRAYGKCRSNRFRLCNRRWFNK